MAEELDYKSVLRKALNLLLEDLDPLPILDYFIQHEFLTPMRIRDIQEIGTTTAKNREIVKSLGAKGLKGYRKFKRFLRDSCQGHLADCLEKIEENVKAEQRLKPRGNTTMQPDGLNAGRNRDRNPNGANSRRTTTIHGAQGAINIFSGTFTNHGTINICPGIGQPGSDVSQSCDAEHVTGATGTQQSSEILYRRESASLQQGANREGDDMIDAAPIDQMEELQISVPKIGPFSPTIVHKTETYFQDIADGRVLVFDGKDLEEVIVEADELQSGSTGKVYCSKKIIEEWGFRIVIKKIPCKGSKLQSVVNEVVAARMKHQGIVPLLAKTNYKDKDQYSSHAYFVFPFMENGDLMNAIREDMKRISKKEKVHMGARQRVLILYQIACAMCFIHTPVKDFRGAVFHGDVTTKNIVLDKEYNARLLDFGVARELEFEESFIQFKTGEPIGTPGYITVLSKVELSPISDCTNFGVVILEMLTGIVPKKENGWELRKENMAFLEDIHVDCYESVWRINHSVYDKLRNLAGECLKEETDSKSLARSLHEILSDDFNFNWEGKSGKTTMQSSIEETEESKKKRCFLCLINWAVDDVHNLRLDGCVSGKKHVSPHVCVACMRNSYLNPIKCRKCRGTIHTNIGYSWGAILVEGFAMDEKEVAFKNDVRSMDKILTSKYPLVFGLDPDNVISTTMEGLGDAVDKLQKKACIATVLVYYSGHHTKKKGFKINRDSYWEVKKFSEALDHVKHEIILVLDCCEAGSIEVGSRNIILRFNSSNQDEVSIFNEYDSKFTKFFIQATKYNQCTKQCQLCEEYKPESLQPGFIALDRFFRYIKQHISDCCKPQHVTFGPTMTCKKETNSHFYIGYSVAGKREIRFDLEEGNDYVLIEDGLPCEMNELRNLLLENILKSKFNGDVKNWSDYWKDNEKRWQTFSSAIRVRITKGPHPQHTSELITIQQVVDAWNKKFELKFGFRDIQNIEKGKVVVIPEKMSTQQVIEVFRTIKDRYKDCLELDAVEEETKVTILYRTFCEQKGHTDVQVPWLKEIMLSIIRNQNLQKEAKKLIITILPELENERLMMEIPRTTTV